MANSETKQTQVNNRTSTGVILLIAGLFLLFNKLHFFFLPHFVFSWPLILVLIGFVLGLRDGFKNNSWWILMLIGGCFLIIRSHFFFGMHLFSLPVILIAIGLIILLNNRKIEEGTKNYQYTTVTEVKQIK